MTEYLGLRNENEYYSDHYLAEVLANDLKGLADSKDEKNTYTGALRQLAREYPRRRHDWTRTKDLNAILEKQREWFAKLLSALGYEYQIDDFALENDGELPALAQQLGQDGRIRLVVLEAYHDNESELTDALTLLPIFEQFNGGKPPLLELLQMTWEEILDKHIMPMRNPPRWILLLSVSQILLIDRYKWGEKRFLRVEFDELFSRVDTASLNAFGSLFFVQSLVGIDGQILADKLDQNSHQHAHGVSADLKYALRTSIELLANEAIWDLKTRLKERVYETDERMASELGTECLRYMYRLLFLFFLEARPELNLVPMKSSVYLQGYSLDHLRNLEMVDLSTEKTKNGFYFHETLQTLFALVRDGFGNRAAEGGELALEQPVFTLRKIDSRLFSDDRLPTLRRVRIRNFVLQRIIKSMSLSQPVKGKRRRRGRISYSQLGVNQLGAVYEALLPYRGIFAESDLYEVKSAKASKDPLAATYLVSAEDIEKYNANERVYDTDEQGRQVLCKHVKGSFLFRLAGRDRKKTASYYTPESLTKCVVKYALKARLTDDMKAADILDLTVCEPAMGSAAFLNEAVNQLADKYLELRQRELNERIPASDYQSEQRKVRQFIADRNVYGVDLNPVATELGELSLWLNCMHENGHVPWFGFQIKTGNSIIGARRATYTVEELRSGEWKQQEPVARSDSTRENSAIYHFLLPYPDILDYAKKRNEVVDLIVPNAREKVVEWRKEFTKKLTDEELDTLRLLSSRIDELWSAHLEQLKIDRDRTEDELDYWGKEAPPNITDPTDFDAKDNIRNQGVYDMEAITASPWRRLKFVMDYWCALWFWPLDKLDLLPTREQWYNEITLILTGQFSDPNSGDGELFLSQYLREQRQKLEEILERVGSLDWDLLKENYETIELVEAIADEQRFHHWELEYADIFDVALNGEQHNGFDLVIGNPPWVVPLFDESGVMSDFDSMVAVRNYRAPRVSAEVKGEVPSNQALGMAWLTEWCNSQPTKSFLTCLQNFYRLRKQQANLFKPFVVRSWALLATNGVTGLLHPDSLFTDAQGQAMREEMYKRLRFHFQFHNEKLIFKDVHHETIFGISVYGSIRRGEPHFDHLSNLFAPETINGCYSNDGSGTVPLIRNERNEWNTKPHSRRIIEVDESTLRTFAQCADKQGTSPHVAKLMRTHSNDSLAILTNHANYRHKLSDFSDRVFLSGMWHETGAVKDGTIKRDTKFVEDWTSFVYSAPHFFCSNPFRRTPKEVCVQSSDYNVLDLTYIPHDFKPRTNFVPACSPNEYQNLIPALRWQQQINIASKYRAACRERVGSSSERSLIVAVIPPKTCHINALNTLTFESHLAMVDFVGFSSSIPVDYKGRVAGVTNFLPSVLLTLPVIDSSSTSLHNDAIRARTLGLNCLTTAYADLWKEICNSIITGQQGSLLDRFQADSWTSNDRSLPHEFWGDLTTQWTRDSALRTDRARRQALLEIDVLSAQILGFTLKELIACYEEQFAVLSNYERNTWYDSNGRIIRTANKGSVPINVPLKAINGDDRWSIQSPGRSESNISLGWEEIKNLKEGKISVGLIDDTLPGGPVNRTIEFKAPFVKPDRVSDYENAWAEFERRFGVSRQV